MDATGFFLPVAQSGSSQKRRGWDLNPRCPYGHAGFQDRCNRPLCHLSEHCRHRTRILCPPRELVQPNTLDFVGGTFPTPHVPRKRRTISGRLLSGIRCSKYSEDSDVWSFHTEIPPHTDPVELRVGILGPYAISSDLLALIQFERTCCYCSSPRFGGERWGEGLVLFANDLFRASSPPAFDAATKKPFAGRD